MKSKVTMHRLAEEAQVSTATVSRVLTGHPMVAPETRERVQSLIDKYQYRPNGFARSLVRQQSNMLGMLVQDIENPYFANMYLQAERFAAEHGYALLMTSSISFKNERDSLLALMEWQIDGLLMVSSSLDAMVPAPETLDFLRTIQRKARMLMINEPVKGFAGPYVVPDNYGGYRKATQYLISLGHRNIAFVGGSDDTRTIQIRHQAYCDAMTEAGLTPDPTNTCFTGYSVDAGSQGMMRLLGNGNLPTAILTSNDMVAMGVMKTCHQQRLEVPIDLSVISCDRTYISYGMYPELTTIDISPEKQGELAVERLLSLIHGEGQASEVVRVPAQLCVRGSTAKLTTR